jgi:hypothetical protein
MKLAPPQVERVEERIECQAIPEDHAATPQLATVFGKHTFFLDSEGLSIVEPSPEDDHVGSVVKLAHSDRRAADDTGSASARADGGRRRARSDGRRRRGLTAADSKNLRLHATAADITRRRLSIQGSTSPGGTSGKRQRCP